VESEKLLKENKELASEVLKRETLHVHRVVESTGFMKDVLSPSLIVESYAHLLRKLLGVLAPVEGSVERSSFLRHFPSVIERQAVQKLQEDLLFLGHGFNPSLYHEDPFPPCSSLGATGGALYVLEGSANGGRIFYRFLQSRLGLSDGAGLSYFAMQAAGDGLRFKAFKQELDKNLVQDDLKDALEYANLTFRRFA
jgi:heme oxygenase